MVVVEVGAIVVFAIVVEIVLEQAVVVPAVAAVEELQIEVKEEVGVGVAVEDEQ